MVVGTIGYGKSHILAAMACYWLKKGEPVVYVPDCQELLEDPINYLKPAFYLTFHNNQQAQREIAQCNTLEEIKDFCNRSPMQFYFIMDQWNALDSKEEMKRHMG